MELLKNAAKNVNTISRDWEQYKKKELDEFLRSKEPTNPRPSTPKLPPEPVVSTSDDPLTVLRNLTRSKEHMKALISSRLPYKSLRENFPSYGWRFFVEKNIVTPMLFDDDSPTSSQDRRSRARSRSSSSGRKRHESPAEVLLRISTPTHNTLTRTAIQLNAVHVKDYGGKACLPPPECETCKRRKVESSNFP